MVASNSYFHVGSKDEASVLYEQFRKCLPQLTDDQELTGDLSGKWIIFKDGWVYGLASYNSREEAIQFASQIFRDDATSPYIIAQVDVEQHMVSPLHLLGDALSELDFEARSGEV